MTQNPGELQENPGWREKILAFLRRGSFRFTLFGTLLVLVAYFLVTLQQGNNSFSSNVTDDIFFLVTTSFVLWSSVIVIFLLFLTPNEKWGVVSDFVPYIGVGALTSGAVALYQILLKFGIWPTPQP